MVHVSQRVCWPCSIQQQFFMKNFPWTSTAHLKGSGSIWMINISLRYKMVVCKPIRHGGIPLHKNHYPRVFFMAHLFIRGNLSLNNHESHRASSTTEVSLAWTRWKILEGFRRDRWSHSGLTRPGPPKCSRGREFPLFQGSRARLVKYYNLARFTL